MTDDDLTPPPDEPLPEQARARIRSELLEAAQGERTHDLRRWTVPVVAAAAVLTVVGLAAWAVQLGGDDGGGGAPAVAPTSTSTTEPPGPDWSMGWSDAPDPEPSEPTGKATLNLSTCVDDMAQVLPGAQQVLTFPSGGVGGDTTVWVAGDRFVLCDVRAGTTTVLKPVSMTHSPGVAPFRVSSIFAPTADGYRAIRVAGGLVPDGVMAFDVRYTFPDGHTERARTTTDDEGRTWWRMVYAYDDGGGSELDKPPIEVTVGYSGVQQTYSLQWGLDTCAQANHGC